VNKSKIILRSPTAHIGEKNSHKISIRKREGERPRGKPERKREDNIKMDLKEMCEMFIAVS
jgi:hypothetical protein